jgi:Flp pilus assembly protein protease CpaA
MLSAQTFATNRLDTLISNLSPKARWTAALLFPLVVGPIWCLAWHGYGGRFGTLSGLVLFGALITSSVTDYNRQRIFNWTTYSAFLWALIINVVASTATYGTEPFAPAFESAQIVGPALLGGVGIGECLVGAAACFLITMFGYDLSGGGAGDVKLATVIGAFLGLHDGVFAVAYSYVVAAIAIIAWSTWKNGPLALLKAGLRAIGRFFGPLWPFPMTSDDQTLLATPVPLGPYFAIGTLLILFGLAPS